MEGLKNIMAFLTSKIKILEYQSNLQDQKIMESESGSEKLDSLNRDLMNAADCKNKRFEVSRKILFS